MVFGIPSVNARIGSPLSMEGVLQPLHHPEPPRRQRQTIPADGGVLTGRVHGTPDGATVSLSHTVRDFCNPQRIPRRAKAAQHIPMLAARFGSEKRWQGECYEGQV